jgi:hypothetical protein
MCPYCDQIFASGIIGDKHISAKHKDHKGVKCPRDKCDTHVSRYSDLKRHLETVHEETDDLYPYHTIIPTHDAESLADLTQVTAQDVILEETEEAEDAQTAEPTGEDISQTVKTSQEAAVEGEDDQHSVRSTQRSPTPSHDADQPADDHNSEERPTPAGSTLSGATSPSTSGNSTPTQREQTAAPTFAQEISAALEKRRRNIEAAKAATPSPLEVIADVASQLQQAPPTKDDTPKYDIHTKITVDTRTTKETLTATITKQMETIDLGGTTTAHAEEPAQSRLDTEPKPTPGSSDDAKGSDRASEEAPGPSATEPDAEVPRVSESSPVPPADVVVTPTPAEQEAGTPAAEAVATQAEIHTPPKPEQLKEDQDLFD